MDYQAQAAFKMSEALRHGWALPHWQRQVIADFIRRAALKPKSNRAFRDTVWTTYEPSFDVKHASKVGGKVPCEKITVSRS